MHISQINYKNSAVLTFTLRDAQSAPTAEQMDHLIDCFLEATDAGGFIQGHFGWAFDGDKTLKISVPLSKEVGDELTAGMTFGYFIGQVDKGKLINYWERRTCVEQFDPTIEYNIMQYEGEL